MSSDRHLSQVVASLGLISVSLLVSGLCSPTAHAEEDQPAATVQENMDVGFEYTLTVDGAVVDSTEGKEPFHYVHGQHQIVPGLERELAGLKVGDAKEVTIKPEEGYGPVDPTALVELPKAQLPSEVTPTVGMVLRGVNPDGKMFRATITGVKDDAVTLDLNHPLAGKTLTFKVKITDIKPAQAQAS